MLLGLGLFTGCAEPTPNVAFNASMHKEIKKIDIIVPNDIEEFTVYYHNHPGMNFGLIGGLAAAAEFATKKSSYNALLTEKTFNANSYFVQKLEMKLKDINYTVNILPEDKERKNELLSEYPKTNADAYLDTVLTTVGYVAGGPSADYKATVTVKVRVVKASDKSIVYDKHIATGETFGLGKEVEYLNIGDEYSYDSSSNLQDNAMKSLGGIKKALDTIANHIAKSLK